MPDLRRLFSGVGSYLRLHGFGAIIGVLVAAAAVLGYARTWTDSTLVESFLVETAALIVTAAIVEVIVDYSRRARALRSLVKLKDASFMRLAVPIQGARRLVSDGRSFAAVRKLLARQQTREEMELRATLGNAVTSVFGSPEPITQALNEIRMWQGRVETDIAVSLEEVAQCVEVILALRHEIIHQVSPEPETLDRLAGQFLKLERGFAPFHRELRAIGSL